MYFTITSRSPEETEKIGKLISGYLKEGDCIPLFGEMGTGKTCLVRGISKGFNIPDNEVVHSPSFTLINKYVGEKTIYHIDLYRLSDESELLELGFEELFKQNAIFFVEWPEIAVSFLPQSHLKIRIMWSFDNLNMRDIVFFDAHDRFKPLFEELKCADFRY